MLRKNEVFLQRIVEVGKVPAHPIIGGKVTFSRRSLIVLGIELHAIEGESALLGLLKKFVTEVSGINADAVIETFFLEKNRERIHFFSCCAPCHPYTNKGVSSQDGNDLLADCDVKLRITEERRHMDRECADKIAELVGMMQQPFFLILVK